MKEIILHYMNKAILNNNEPRLNELFHSKTFSFINGLYELM